MRDAHGRGKKRARAKWAPGVKQLGDLARKRNIYTHFLISIQYCNNLAPMTLLTSTLKYFYDKPA